MTTTSQQDRIDTGSESLKDSLLELLANPRSYPETTCSVERIDTHISWVFLTERFVYKLKKPVQYDFLDFSAPQHRHWACEQEVRLNRRLARNVYVGVVPITSNQHDRLQLGGSGEPVDWVVKMHRLPAERALDHLIHSRKVTEADVNELAVRLVEFYEQLPPLSVNVEQYRHQIEEHIAGNQRELSTARLDADALERVYSAQIRLLRLAPELIDRRVCDGRIVDGHGDLRPEHIYFDSYPTIIDCLEFNDELRRLDVLDELAFLAAECEHLGAAWIGNQVIERYRATSGDRFPQVLLEFYKTYRACVRAKVATLRASQLEGCRRRDALADAQRHLQLADRHAARIGPPVLLVVYGLSGTGKTTLAQRLAEQLQIEYFETDMIRHDLFGRSVAAADYGEAIYQPSLRRRVYDELFRRAGHRLCNRLSVILDGTFFAADLRRQAIDLARRHEVMPLLIHCHCEAESAVGRILSRTAIGKSHSDATPDIHQRQRHEFEPDPPDLPICHVNTDAGLAEVTHAVFSELRPLVSLHSQTIVRE